MLIHFSHCHADVRLVKVPKPSTAEYEEKPGDKPEIPLPQTMVRIPVESESTPEWHKEE